MEFYLILIFKRIIDKKKKIIVAEYFIKVNKLNITSQ